MENSSPTMSTLCHGSTTLPPRRISEIGISEIMGLRSPFPEVPESALSSYPITRPPLRYRATSPAEYRPETPISPLYGPPPGELRLMPHSSFGGRAAGPPMGAGPIGPPRRLPYWPQSPPLGNPRLSQSPTPYAMYHPPMRRPHPPPEDYIRPPLPEFRNPWAKTGPPTRKRRQSSEELSPRSKRVDRYGGHRRSEESDEVRFAEPRTRDSSPVAFGQRFKNPVIKDLHDVVTRLERTVVQLQHDNTIVRRQLSEYEHALAYSPLAWKRRFDALEREFEEAGARAARETCDLKRTVAQQREDIIACERDIAERDDIIEELQKVIKKTSEG